MEKGIKMYINISKILLLKFILLISIISCSSNRINFEYNIDNLIKIYNEAKNKLENTLFQMEDQYYVINTYGFEKHPIRGDIIFRDYIFINLKYNSKIFSISDGEIIETGYNHFWGIYIKIKYNDLEIIYGNLLKIEINIGDIVSMGDIIGYGGVNTVFGDGITLRIKYNNYFLNPIIIMNFDNIRELN